MNRIKVGQKFIGEGSPVFVIAEAGVNHNGDLETARRMVKAAAEAGADAVKFQTFRAEDFVSSPAVSYSYESQGKKVTEPILDMFRRLELPRSWHEELLKYARSLGLIPFSTPQDLEAVELLLSLDVSLFKVGSDDLTNLPFLSEIAKKGKPMIISCGMGMLGEVEQAVETIMATGNEELVLLHCISLYPTPAAKANLLRMKTLKDAFGLPVGFSDHTFGISVPLAAVALGACVIEKHFTLARNSPGPDHRFSADPAELTALCAGIREVEESLGTPVFRLSKEEQEMKKLCRRSIVARQSIPKGTRLTREMLAFKRPGTGISPGQLDLLLGREVRETLQPNQMISWEVV